MGGGGGGSNSQRGRVELNSRFLRLPCFSAIMLFLWQNFYCSCCYVYSNIIDIGESLTQNHHDPILVERPIINVTLLSTFLAGQYLLRNDVGFCWLFIWYYSSPVTPIMSTLPSFLLGGSWTSNQIFKKGGLKRGVVKSQIFNDKKKFINKYFSLL